MTVFESFMIISELEANVKLPRGYAKKTVPADTATE